MKKKITRLLPLYIFLIYFFISILYSCGANIFSVEYDVQLGEEFDKEIRSNPKEYPLIKDNQAITDYVSSIGKYIINTSPSIEYKKIFPYKFQVIDDTIINAFCTPGGFIYVYTGLMKFVDNEATLAGVLAHEIAHAENRHTTQRITSYYGVSMLLSLVLGNNPNAYAELAANLFTGLAFLANSRSDEKEADDYSIKYLRATKYYPGSIMFFFTKIRDEQSKKGYTPGGFERLLSTHPLPSDRIENVKERLKAIKPSPDSTIGIFKDEYQLMKLKLK